MIRWPGTKRTEKARGRTAKAYAKSGVAANSEDAPHPDASGPSPLLPGQYEFSPGVLTLSSPHVAAHAIRKSAMAIVGHHIDLGRRGLAVCGAASGAGVTFTAVNIAVCLADLGVSTMLIDGNLRRPALETFIRPGRPGPGLQQHLRAPEDLDRIVHADVLPNLSLIYSGGPAEDAQELLTGEAFRATLRECMRNYDCTLLDTPASNRSADALLAASAVSYALIVARRGASYAEDVEMLARELTKDNVVIVGSVLNGA